MKPHLVRIEEIFKRIEETKNVKKSRLLLDTGIDPAQYRTYLRNDYPLSDMMIDRLSESVHLKELGIDRVTLESWRAMDEVSAGAILKAFQELAKDPKTGKEVYKKSVEIIEKYANGLTDKEFSDINSQIIEKIRKEKDKNR